jgi:ABC-type Mn2+/Zn2+ transport system permease subunit
VAEVVDFLLEPWRSGIGMRALVEVVLVGALGGAVGFWVLTFGLAYGAESTAHGLLPALVVAALAGLPLLVGAGVGVILAAGVLALAAADERAGPDAATAVAVTGLLGGGGALALAPEVPPNLEALLFGDPLAATALDLAFALAVAVLGALALAALHRPLTLLAFDRSAARSLGVRPNAVLLGLGAVGALVVSAAVKGLGNLLVLAVLVAPAVAARRHASTPRGAMLGGAGVAVLAGVTGLYASYHLELAAGASVALCLCVAAAVGAAAPARGLKLSAAAEQ